MKKNIPTFNNKENEQVQIGGRTIYLSRSVAMYGVVIVEINNKAFVLVSKRGKGTPNEVGKTNLVCGYLDNNETTYQGVLREIWEETGFDIQKYSNKVLFTSNTFNKSVFYNNFGKPITQDDIQGDGDNGNISLGYVFKIDLSALGYNELPKLTNEYSEPNEVEDPEWIPFDIKHILEKDFAFNHDMRLIEIYNKLYIGNDAIVERNQIINNLGGSINLDIPFVYDL